MKIPEIVINPEAGLEICGDVPDGSVIIGTIDTDALIRLSTGVLVRIYAGEVTPIDNHEELDKEIKKLIRDITKNTFNRGFNVYMKDEHLWMNKPMTQLADKMFEGNKNELVRQAIVQYINTHRKFL